MTSRPLRRAPRALLLALVSAATLVAACDTDDDPVAPPAEFPLAFDGALTSLWPPSVAEDITLTPGSALGVLPATDRRIVPGYYVWDSWPVRTPDGAIARVDGWYVLVALTARDTLLPGARHGVAELRYLVSRDGADWQLGGRVFEAGTAVGNAQWAGSTVYDPATRRVRVFYTAIGYGDVRPDGSDPTAGENQDASRQRLVMATGTLVAAPNGVSMGDWGEHRVILEPEGRWYEQRGAADGIWAFRDPWYFRDPRSGRSFLLFTANLGFVDPGAPSAVRLWPQQAPLLRGSRSGGPLFSHGGHDGPTHDVTANGAVGLAVAETEDLTQWRLLPPLLGAPGVNSQLERPHFVWRDNRYYLFFSSHAFTFQAPLSGPDGLYGFVADSLTGLYLPLNGTGLVAGNPSAAPLQTYSYLVLPSGRVMSYVGYQNLGGVGLGGIAQQSPAWQRDHFGGTLAPTFTLSISGQGTTLGAFDPAGSFRLLAP